MVLTYVLSQFLIVKLLTKPILLRIIIVVIIIIKDKKNLNMLYTPRKKTELRKCRNLSLVQPMNIVTKFYQYSFITLATLHNFLFTAGEVAFPPKAEMCLKYFCTLPFLLVSVCVNFDFSIRNTFFVNI